MATITLAYSVDKPPTMPGAAFTSSVSGADIFEGELDYLSMTVDSDTTLEGPTVVTRTIVLLTDATSDALFPTDADKQAATRNLYKAALATKIPGVVSASAPVVAP